MHLRVYKNYYDCTRDVNLLNNEIIISFYIDHVVVLSETRMLYICVKSLKVRLFILNVISINSYANKKICPILS